MRVGIDAISGHRNHRHLPPAAGKSDYLHVKPRISIGCLCIGRTPIGHYNGRFLGQEIRALPFNRLISIGCFRIHIPFVNQFLQIFKPRAHIVAVFSLPFVKCFYFFLCVPPVIQIGISYCKHEILQPPSVGANRGFYPVFFQHPAAFQQIFRCLRKQKAILVKQVFVYKKAMHHNLLGDCNQFSVYGIGRLYDFP